MAELALERQCQTHSMAASLASEHNPLVLKLCLGTSGVVLILVHKGQVVPLKEPEALPAEKPSSAALPMHKPRQEDRCRPTAADPATQ